VFNNRVANQQPSKIQRNLRITYIIVSVLMYIFHPFIRATFLMLFCRYSVLVLGVTWEFTCSCRNFVFRFEGYFAGSLSIIVSVFFLVVGPQVHKEAKRVASYNNDTRHNRQLTQVRSIFLLIYSKKFYSSVRLLATTLCRWQSSP
jgi:hypothetical protein